MELLLLLALVTLSVAQVPKPCYSPPLFEGRVYDYYPANSMFIHARLSVDGFNHRIRVHDEHIIGQTVTKFDFIQLYDLGIVYTFSHEYQNCTQSALTQKWQDFFGIHADATFYTEAYMDSAVLYNGIQVNLWGVNETSGTTYAGAWTSDACIPVFQKWNSPRSGISYVNFFDVTLGIADPNVFIPPSYCTTKDNSH